MKGTVATVLRLALALATASGAMPGPDAAGVAPEPNGAAMWDSAVPIAPLLHGMDSAANPTQAKDAGATPSRRASIETSAARPRTWSAEAAQAADEIAANIESRLRSLQTMQAEFEQAYFSMATSEPLREKGVFSFQKPDLMRWAYAAPEENLFLYKDGVFLFYIAEENQLIVSRAAGDRYESEVLALFTGSRRLTDDYIVEPTAFPTENRNTAQIRLTPREEETETSGILIEADRKSWLIQRAVFFDWAGNKQEFTFRRIRTGVKFPAGHFDFEPPPGCEIIEDDRRGPVE